MAISIDWGNTFVITVNQSDLTLVTGSLYEMDTNWFRLQLKDLEDDPDGMPWPKTHLHNTPVTVAGTTFSRTIEILPPYSVKFLPDTKWTVRLAGSNNNIFDVENGILVQNNVQVISGNSAGLTTVDVSNNILATQISESYAPMGEAPTLAQAIMMMMQMLTEFDYSGKTLTIRSLDGTTEIASYELDDANRPTGLRRVS